ncbi:hypothetical protein MKK75_21885 [Methylobacterium sp. J-030]|nr:hypothetical protein [Methylobacterium sp. J-030]
MAKRKATIAARPHGPTPEDWIEVLENPTTGPVVAGRFYGLGRNASYNSCESGDLPQAFRAGGQWRVPTEPLLQKVGLIGLEAREAALRRAREAIAARAAQRCDTRHAGSSEPIAA